MDQELVQYLDERFGWIEQRLDVHDERFDEVKRHTGVLVEGLRHELHLVVEGLVTHIDVRHTDDRAYVDQRFQETNTLVRLSLETTEQLRRRIESLRAE